MSKFFQLGESPPQFPDQPRSVLGGMEDEDPSLQTDDLTGVIEHLDKVRSLPRSQLPPAERTVGPG
jgi:hypothetical protein